MKCSKCSFVARDIGGMGAHYRKKHPAAMRKHTPRRKTIRKENRKTHKATEYCSKCGQKT